jgi:hypothetical protein
MDESNQKMYIFGGYGESKLGNTKLYLVKKNEIL